MHGALPFQEAVGIHTNAKALSADAFLQWAKKLNHEKTGGGF
jgi:hypothetical protein